MREESREDWIHRPWGNGAYHLAVTCSSRHSWFYAHTLIYYLWRRINNHCLQFKCWSNDEKVSLQDRTRRMHAILKILDAHTAGRKWCANNSSALALHFIAWEWVYLYTLNYQASRKLLIKKRYWNVISAGWRCKNWQKIFRDQKVTRRKSKWLQPNHARRISRRSLDFIISRLLYSFYP